MVIFSIFIGISSSYTLYASSKKQKITSHRKYQLAEQLLANRNYSKAAIIYKELLDKASRNADLNFKLGLCYLNISSQKEKSVGLIEKAIQYTSSKNNVSLDVYFNLAKAYHTNYQFRDALKVYRDLLQIISPQNIAFRNEIQREINMCKNGLELIKNPIDISITNLGNKINTEYAEHSPGITADESTMVFTSRRKGTGGKIDIDGQYFEDIYITHRINGIWTDPVGISELNTNDHDASISISADGQELYIYKAGYFSKKESEGGDIYVSHLNGSRWSAPRKLGPNINSKSKESHISISADARTIYFSSDRPGGFGGMDIYTVTKLPNGKWGKARNLGPAINTEYDDDAPFIHPDGKTLYFSSAGHKTMGGLDIFKSVNIKGRWTSPKNIGYPINSTDDDIYYTPTADGKRAYFASYRKGSVGRTDIFLVKTPNADEVGLFVLKGKVVTSDGKPVPNSKITVSRNGQTIGIYNPNSATGKFLFIVDAGKKYKIEIVAEGFRTLRTTLNIPPEFANKENHSVITLLPLTLRSKYESDYPQSMELINFEESKLNEVNSTLSKVDSIPENREFKAPPIAVPEKVIPKKEDTVNAPVVIPDSGIIPVVTPVVSDKKIEEVQEEKPIISQKEQASKDKVKIWKKKSIPNQPKSQIKAIASRNLAFTLDLGNFNAPKPELFEKLDGVIESVGPDKRYHYTYGKFKNYKEASKIQKIIAKKGFNFTNIRILEKDQLVQEKSGGETYYTIQIMALHLPIEAEFFDNLDNVKVFNGMDGMTRYTYKKFTSYRKAINEMKRLIRMGYWDAFVRTVINDQLLYSGMQYSEQANYTIQVMALRNPKPLNYFNDLGNVQVFIDHTGLYRYTYGNYHTKNEAILDLGTALKKGYWDAFVRKSLKGEQLPNKELINSSNYYTIQVMALRNFRPLNYFNNLGIENMNLYKGKDGLSRYTYQKFSNLSNAKNSLPFVIKKGYLDAFTREIKWYNQH
ncbi:PD40 domain-containing protein [Ancylomarina longa]|uniref:PD40 domain-containing protein n=1 Tax=Ancylomarina longa TaxID=2487017 RepID=UPI0011D0A123|nr:PD40 domain-containing protein [Ancylomarina longa]